MPFHPTALAHHLKKLISPYGSKHGHIGLQQQTQAVTHIIHFPVNWPLRQSQEVHVGQLCEKNIVS
jgi:hypothetical protein